MTTPPVPLGSHRPASRLAEDLPHGRQEAPCGTRHPDYGRLIRDEATDTVVCHVCGRAFRALGAHVRVHQMSAADYRQAFGLLRTAPLSARSLSREQSLAHVAIYAASPETQVHFATGQAMARSGELVRKRWGSDRERTDPEQLRRRRQDTLAAGRRTRARTADDRLAAALQAGGFTDIGHALRTIYTDQQNSIEDTARTLAVGKARLRQLLIVHGITIRPTGQNSTAGRRARADINDQKAADRVGTHDIDVWLREQAADGATLRGLAAATGRSIPWVASRIGPR